MLNIKKINKIKLLTVENCLKKVNETKIKNFIFIINNELYVTILFKLC